MVSKFTSDFFAGNRRRLRELFTGTAPIVLAANGQMQRQADAAFPFYQDPSFWYLTGCDESDVVLVMDKDKEYLIVPARDEIRVAFEGAVDDAALRRISGVEQILDDQEGWRRLGARLARAKHVATLAAAPAYIDHFSMYANPARRHLIHKMKQQNDKLELLDISQHVTRLRMIKQPVEVETIQAAIDVTNQGLKQLFRTLKRGSYAYEFEAEADLTRSFRKAGARGHAFEPIIAAGKNACTLHNIHNDSPLSTDELLLCDVGAEVDHYAADITRTVAIGTPSRRQQAVFDAVKEVHAYALGLLKPGVLMKEYEKQVETFMGECLRELGLMKSIEPQAVRSFYPHATSHFLGLTAHDAGLYDQPLEPGMVLTVEPGIYIPDEAIGARIEDDVLLTAEGNQVLSDALPILLA